MASRREFMKRGFGAVAIGLLAKAGHARPITRRGPTGISADPADPIGTIPDHPNSRIVDGIPFSNWFTGEDLRQWGDGHLAFDLAGDNPPPPSEKVKVAVVGGGLSGLTAAYLLRDHAPVVFDLHKRFGGNAQGERWRDTDLSLGSAYVITPDKGTFLDDFYRELGLHRVVRVNENPEPIAVNGSIVEDFWENGSGGSPEEAAAFAEYADIVTFMAEESYPDIPLPVDKDNSWILELDQRTLKQDIEMRMTRPVPPLLAEAIQAYCISSFAAGWDEISAAGGWNFLAAEEFGRWVFPGGNAYMARALWSRLKATERSLPNANLVPNGMLRARTIVTDVRYRANDVQVTFLDEQGTLKSLLASYVVMACPKLVAKSIIHNLATIDPDKSEAMFRLKYAAYMVANVLVNRPVNQRFYDIFLLGEGPTSLVDNHPCNYSPVADVLNGNYARPGNHSRSVLTLYWPLPCPNGRVEMMFNEPWQRWTERLAPQIDGILSIVGLDRSDIEQVRLSRWGHAVPIAEPSLMADGTTGHLVRPFGDRIFFANQDNWALPAVENSLLDANTVANQIRAGL